MPRERTGTIRKRGNTYQIIIDLGEKMADGKRKMYRETLPTEADAKRRLAEVQVDFDRGALATTRATVAEWMAEWLQTYVVGNVAKPKRIRTVERYQSIIEKHIIPALGVVKLAKLTRLDVNRFYAGLVAKNLSGNTITAIHQVLKGALDEALADGLITHNPTFKALKPPRDTKRVTPPSVGQALELLTLASEEEHPLYAAMVLAALTGMRRGEILALRWHHINTAGMFLEVSESLVVTGAGLKVEPPKSKAGNRRIELPGTVIDALDAHRRSQDAQIEAMAGSYADEGRVFANATGGWTHPNIFTRETKALALRVGCPSTFKLHDLRHFTASLLLEQGHSLSEVSGQLGHANAAVTLNTYAHLLPGRGRAMADTIGAAMGKDAAKMPSGAETPIFR